MKEMILKRLGLQCSYYRDSYLQRRIGFRMKKVGINSYMDYAKMLRTDPEEYAQLLREIAVNYTKFFRDEDVQVEDDLIDERETVTNKNVQAYLKDVDFFFKNVSISR